MRAIILAAGTGQRMGVGGIHKSLLRVGGKALITRNIEFLRELDLDITIVIGHQAKNFTGVFGNEATFVHNSRYRETGSLYSLWLANEVLQPKEDVVVVFADMYLSHVFPLLPNCAMVTTCYDGRGARVYLDKNRLVRRATAATDPDPNGVSFCGIACLSPSLIARLNTIRGWMKLPLAYGLVGCQTMQASVIAINVNTPEDLDFARKIHRRESVSTM